VSENSSSPNSGSTSESKPVTTTSAGVSPAVAITKGQLISGCAFGLIICFFLPWVDLLVVKPSGFDLQQADGSAKLFWLIPLLAAFALIAGLTGKSSRTAASVAGAAPFALLAYRLSIDGSDLLRVLAPGAWLSLALGLVLIILSRR